MTTKPNTELQDITKSLSKLATEGTATLQEQEASAVQNTPKQADPKVVEFIAKPTKKKFSLDRFKVDDETPSVGKLPAELLLHKISEAKDFVRLHPDEAMYWSEPLYFVNVPVKGMKDSTLHLIDKALALQFVPSGKLQVFRLALGTKPDDVFFLCKIPCTYLDNIWNRDACRACEEAKYRWIEASSRKAEGKEGYNIRYAEEANAFTEPRWLTQSLEELIGVTFEGRIIDSPDSVALGRLRGCKVRLT